MTYTGHLLCPTALRRQWPTLKKTLWAQSSETPMTYTGRLALPHSPQEGPQEAVAYFEEDLRRFLSDRCLLRASL